MEPKMKLFLLTHLLMSLSGPVVSGVFPPVNRTHGEYVTKPPEISLQREMNDMDLVGNWPPAGYNEDPNIKYNLPEYLSLMDAEKNFEDRQYFPKRRKISDLS